MNIIVKIKSIKEVKALMIECLTFEPIDSSKIGDILISLSNMLELLMQGEKV